VIKSHLKGVILLSEKEIAKDIVLKMLELDLVLTNKNSSELSDIDMICQAYKQILKNISET
jgi:hypothetical protein